MILIGKKLANKAVKVCFYANFQTIAPILKKIQRIFLNKKVERITEYVENQLNRHINGLFSLSFL